MQFKRKKEKGKRMRLTSYEMVGGLLDVGGRQQTATDPALLDANRNRLTLCVELYEKSLINEGSASVVSPYGSSLDNCSLVCGIWKRKI